ncbi:MAG TPA: hypothetical protein PLM75_10740, partial [bacterium]|nr:hypothetical protein [bacterium]
FAELTADKYEIKKIGFQLLKIFTLTNLIIFILGAIIISIALKLMLTKLAKIQSAIKEIKNKNYGYRVKLHSYLKDEFDDFAEQT